MLQNIAETGNELFRNLKNKAEITELKYFMTDFKKAKIWVNCICCPRFTNAYLTFRIGQRFQTVGHLRKTFLSFCIVS